MSELKTIQDPEFDKEVNRHLDYYLNRAKAVIVADAQPSKENRKLLKAR